MMNKNELKIALKTYVEELKNEAYFDAHETLEEAWHPLRKNNHKLKNLVKGLINGAICFEHLKRNRHDAKRKALQVLKSFERHKHLCQKEIEHYELFKRACQNIEELKEVHKL